MATTTRRPLHDLTARLVVASLMIASLASGLSVSIAGRNARPEHLAALAAIVIVAMGIAITRQVPWTINRFTVLAAAWVGVNALSSFFFSPQPWESAVHVVRIALLSATFVLVAYLPRADADEWLRLVRLWLWLAAAQALYGLATWLLAIAGLWLPGARVVEGVPGISIEGTMYERNLFGILAGTATVAALYLLLAQTGRLRPMVASRSALLVVFALSAGALVMALTRSAWVAATLVTPIAFGLAWWRHGARPDVGLIAVVIAVPVGFATLPALAADPGRPMPASTELSGAATSASTPSAVSERVATLRPSHAVEQRTVRTRLADAGMAIDDFIARPILGHGTGSFVMLHGIRAGTPAWISNMPLHTLVDTGLVGLAAQLGLVAAVLVGAWRASVRTSDVRLAAGLQALLLGLLVIGIGYQITDGSWLAGYWIHLGLIVHGVACVDRERHAIDVSL